MGLALRLSVMAACLGALLVCGCAGRSAPPGNGERIDRGPPPSYESVRERWNTRVARLDHVKSPLSILIRATGRDGKKIDEQADGHAEVVLPRRLFLRVDKVSTPLFFLGSNEERFWWVDLTADPRTALVGTHAGVSPARAAELGLPVHPLDLIDLLGITPLPVESPSQPRWSESGRYLIVDRAGRWGASRLHLHPDTLDPARVELLDEAGKVLVSSELREYERVPVAGDALANARLARKADVVVAATGATIGLRFHDPENPGTPARDRAFDFGAIADGYGVTRIIDLDAAAARGESP